MVLSSTEVMSDKVWNKAVKDTAGLKAFYETQKMKCTCGQKDLMLLFTHVRIQKFQIKFSLKKKKNTSDVILEN